MVRINAKKALLESELPNEVTILGQKVKVVVTALKGLHGDFNSDNMTIKINQNASVEAAKSTLFHECLHACLKISGLGELLNEKLEEGIVSMLEIAMLNFISFRKDNK